MQTKIPPHILDHLQQNGVSTEFYDQMDEQFGQELLPKLDAVGLTLGDYAIAVLRLGRHPNDLEIGLIGTMWSEHSGYVHSKPLFVIFDEVNDRLSITTSDG
jgi:phosphoribosylformylglycinamidine (FGAM) synthase-like enzyme